MPAGTLARCQPPPEPTSTPRPHATYRDAELLHKHSRPANADHLAGLAAECALKALIAGYLGGHVNQMVAAMVPSNQAEAYLRNFTDNAQECFAATLYDNEEGAVELDIFNFAPDDPSAPHYPLPISHSLDLVGLNPSRNDSWASTDLVEAAYREFVDAVSDMLEEGA
jgi:hypothetical protein